MKIEKIEGKWYPVLSAIREESPPGRGWDTAKTEPCCFCGKTHYHGASNSHKTPHCFGDNVKKSITITGITVYQSDGYLLEMID
jgi:hypothetical protein